jgi:DNA-binding LacI/PurR family transcriptional regulator
MSDTPTLATIAHLVGVTPVTVSRALRGAPGVGEDTRARVRQVAEELGYHPDYFASAMAERRRGEGVRRGAIACLVGHRDVDPRGRYEHYELVFDGMRERCAAMGFSLEIFWAFEPGMSSRRLHQILQTRSIGGCVLMSLSPHELDFPWEKYCLVQAAANTMHAEVDYSAVDYYNATRLALGELKTRARRDIALVLPRNLDSTMRERIVGAFHSFHSSQDVRRLNRLVVTLDKSWPGRGGRQTEAALCWGSEEASAVSDSWNISATNVARLHLLHRKKGCQGMFIPYRKLGTLALDLLLAKLRERRYGLSPECQGVVIDGKWDAGDS